MRIECKTAFSLLHSSMNILFIQPHVTFHADLVYRRAGLCFRGYAVRKTGAGSLNFNSGFNFDQEQNFPTAKFLLIHLTPKFCLMDCFMILTDLVCEVISENEECGKLLGFIHS